MSGFLREKQHSTSLIDAESQATTAERCGYARLDAVSEVPRCKLRNEPLHIAFPSR
jgi:hypothetical protein